MRSRRQDAYAQESNGRPRAGALDFAGNLLWFLVAAPIIPLVLLSFDHLWAEYVALQYIYAATLCFYTLGTGRHSWTDREERQALIRFLPTHFFFAFVLAFGQFEYLHFWWRMPDWMTNRRVRASDYLALGMCLAVGWGMYEQYLLRKKLDQVRAAEDRK